MPRGNAPQTKVIFKGATDSFVVFVDSEQAVKDWMKDRSVPLAQVMAGFKIFQTHKYVTKNSFL
jgi:Shwachman-Bodian-Diamond syndrome (SBDS) protein